MTQQDEGFLDAILEDPEDDAVRLIYADWLEEHDQPARAEFIRVQIALAKLHAFDPRRAPLARRERELLAAHEIAWVSDLPQGVEGWQFARGFIESVQLPSAVLAAEGEEL